MTPEEIRVWIGNEIAKSVAFGYNGAANLARRYAIDGSFDGVDARQALNEFADACEEASKEMLTNGEQNGG